MKLMRKHVVNKLLAYWLVVCKQLQCSYSTAGLGHDNKKNLIAVLEDWIATGEREGSPRTWSMFITALSGANELYGVIIEICSELQSEGVNVGKVCFISYVHILVVMLTNNRQVSICSCI